MKRVKSFGLICLFGLLSLTASAQSEVATTNLLYNAPYRHFINPAFEPITEGYLYLPALSHISLYAGNNSLSLSNLVINQGGTSMWTLNPNSGGNVPAGNLKFASFPGSNRCGSLVLTSALTQVCRCRRTCSGLRWAVV